MVDDVEIWPKSERSPWQIRDFPDPLRSAVNEQARAEGVTVTELMTRLVVAARDATWSSGAFSGPLNSVQNMSTNSVLRIGSASIAPEKALEMLANMGRAGVPVQKGVATLANRLVKRELRVLLALPGPA